MADAARVAASFAGAAILAAALTQIAIPLARRTDFVDHPAGYKAHGAATPYLGGAAVISACVITSLLFAGGLALLGWVLACTAVLAIVGTIDDRRNIGVGIRFLVQLAAGLILWAKGIAWEPTGIDLIDLPITLLWVTGIANAFNLLDNIDGSTGTTAAVSATGIGVLALIGGSVPLAALAFALSGACIGFLFFNLTRPARIFLGDGGSVPIGFLLAAMAMLIPTSLGSGAVLAAIPLVGVAIFDTSLVVVSRRRRGAPVLSGHRDHVTHRLLGVTGSTRRVARWLAAVQVALCGLALVMEEIPAEADVVIALLYTAVGSALLIRLEAPPFAVRGVEQTA